MSKKILIIFLGNIAHDSRSLKLVKSVKNWGFQVEVICSVEPGEIAIKNPEIKYVKLKKWSKAIFKIIEFYLKSFRLAINSHPDWVIASDLFALPIAWLVSFKKGTKLIYDSREFYSSLASTSKHKFKQNFIYIFEKFFASKSFIILTVNQSIKNFLSRKFKSKPIIVVRNLPTIADIGNREFRVNINLPDITLIYLGHFHPGRGFQIYFDLLKKLQDEGVKSKLLFIGKGELKEKLEKEIINRGLSESVIVTGPYSPNQSIKLPATTKPIGLCLIEPLSLSYIYSLPNKIFEYMKNSIPFVASDFPEIREIVEKYQVGVLANPQNFEEIYSSVKKLIDDTFLYLKLRENCRKALLELNWENEVKKLYEILRA
ncbi:glycosyltransferase [Candidatus Chrysopegis kryptomonas]|uniref:Glycosyltransferase involved in cell wall bisynthesis n=1 Tax=Candidatus Chryseopegocella kryptomonas TaxID=1633643 RepID=A0A0P1MY75_9BACT|nr:glycosyltransferase [Candidatus Chrysopegis kryptomonas]CUT01062.1 Glycosyltransferase involved in cell wall bisynthesis [Candidatus Chrysopegis kryptomonas]